MATRQLCLLWCLLLRFWQSVTACVPSQYSDCRNEEDVITMESLSSIPVAELRILPSRNCMRLREIQRLRHLRDPYTNLKLPAEWQQRCIHTAGGMPSAPSHDSPRVEECPRGQYWNGDACRLCRAGWTTGARGRSSANDCNVGCDAGQYMSDQATGRCQNCALGRYSSNRGASACVQCDVGKYQADIGGTTCRACRPGYTSNSNRDWCEQCGPGTYNAEDAGSCVLCARGRFSGSWAATECAGMCNAGKDTAVAGATRSSDCRWCPRGTSNPVEGGACIECVAGKVTSQEGSTACKSCPPGSSTDGYAGVIECKRCKPGRYAAMHSAASCTACKRGTYSSEAGATSSSSCLPCPPGQTTRSSAANSQNSCEACPAGTFIEAGRETCQQCPAQSWSATVGASSRTTCRKCPTDRPFSYAGSTKAEDCTSIHWEWYMNAAILTLVSVGLVALWFYWQHS